MTRYQIVITFADYKVLEIAVDSIEDIRKHIAEDLESSTTLWIADYIISTENILYIKVEGEYIEKPRGKERKDSRKKK